MSIKFIAYENDKFTFPKREYATMEKAVKAGDKWKERHPESIVTYIDTESAKDKMRLQYARLANRTLDCSPTYVKKPSYMVSYISGPNWRESGCEYAHFEMTVAIYGKELADEFNAIRAIAKKNSAKAGLRLAELTQSVGIRVEE